MNRKSKAFWEQVRGAYERGEGSYQELAERFGVSKRTICSHGKNEAWKKTEPLLRPEQRAMREVTQKLHSAAMREVERLEEQVYFQERTLSALNEAITLQQRQLDDLQGRMEAVEEKFRELWELVGNEGGEATVPPHYMKLA